MESKKKLNKLFQGLLILLLSINLINAVEVIDKNSQQVVTQEGVSEGFRQGVITIFSIGLVFVLFVFLLIVFAWILIKVWKKLSEHQRRKKNLIYDIFLYDIDQCHFSHDPTMKKRNWKLLWLFWKRRPVYIENAKGQLEVIGLYHGETYKKEGFYLLGLYNKLGLFKYVGQIIIIPLEIKERILKKIDGEGKRLMFLSCEGVDRIAGSDFYFMPLIPDPKKKEGFIDFSDKIHKDYFELETYRDIITENLASYKKVVINSVETNPFVHFGRRGGENFKK